MEIKKKRVAVIGAGIAGLVAAYELIKAGIDARVFEKNGSVGGRMMTRTKNELPFNGGATFLGENYTLLKHYADEFSIPWTPMEPGSAQRVLRGGQQHAAKLKNLLDVFRLSAISRASQFRLARFLLSLAVSNIRGDFFDLSTTDAAMNAETAEHYLLAHADADVKDYIADPFIGALHFHRTDEVSAAVLLTFMKMILGNRKFTLLYPEAGIQAIPDALARRLTMVKNADMRELARTKDGRVRLRINGNGELFDAAVLACPAPVAKKLLTAPTQTQTRMLDAIHYASTIVVSFVVPADLFTDNTHCVYVPYRESTIVSSYIFEKRKGAALVRDGKTLLNVYLWDEAARMLFLKSDEEIASAVQAELFKLSLKIRTREREISFYDSERWEYAMPKFTCESISAVNAFLEYGQGKGNVFFAGDYMNAPWTEGAARSGKRVADLIAKRLAAS